MENEIKVGEYIRTKLGDIKKITEGFEFIIERHNKSDNNIVKHSPNIIDLIECGDYVNGEKVLNIIKIYDENEKPISKRLLTEYRKAQYNGTYRQYYIYEQDIKKVVTKEMMESISYKVKE